MAKGKLINKINEEEIICPLGIDYQNLIDRGEYCSACYMDCHN